MLQKCFIHVFERRCFIILLFYCAPKMLEMCFIYDPDMLQKCFIHVLERRCFIILLFDCALKMLKMFSKNARDVLQKVLQNAGDVLQNMI
jgi:hypothetical protein